jgi:hypothetical protein
MSIVNFNNVKELIVKSGIVTIDGTEYIGVIDCSGIVGEHDFTYTGDFLIKPFKSGESKIILNQNIIQLQNQIDNLIITNLNMQSQIDTISIDKLEGGVTP